MAHYRKPLAAATALATSSLLIAYNRRRTG